MHLAGRPTPSIACVVQPGVSGGFQKVFFGREEIAIPLSSRCFKLLRTLCSKLLQPADAALAEQESRPWSLLLSCRLEASS